MNSNHLIVPIETTTEYDMAEPFACHCGSPRCFGTIRGFKHLTEDERERLRPFLAPHLASLLDSCTELEFR